MTKLVLLLALGCGATPQFATLPASAASFKPIDPNNANGPQMAILYGDPAGPHAYLIKLSKGSGPPHWHTADYYAITLEGTTRHTLAGKEADAKDDPPETFRFQPGGGPATTHKDECVSDHCLVFGYMTGAYDIHPVK